MSKIALKVTHKFLRIAERVFDDATTRRIEALYAELKAKRGRDDQRYKAAKADALLETALREELHILEDDDDEEPFPG